VHSSALMRACAEILSPLGYSPTSLDPDPEAARRRDIYQMASA
jgi:hypothetical protein